MNELWRELVLERFGRPPVAELRRPLAELVGCGGPDTQSAIRERRRVLLESLPKDEEVA